MSEATLITELLRMGPMAETCKSESDAQLMLAVCRSCPCAAKNDWACCALCTVWPASWLWMVCVLRLPCAVRAAVCAPVRLPSVPSGVWRLGFRSPSSTPRPTMRALSLLLHAPSAPRHLTRESIRLTIPILGQHCSEPQEHTLQYSVAQVAFPRERQPCGTEEVARLKGPQKARATR